VRPLARKQGTPRSVTEAHYILATTSLKFRAWFTKFQADMPGVMKHAILLVRLAVHGLWRTWRQRKGYITTSGRASSLLLIICETKHGLAQTGILWHLSLVSSCAVVRIWIVPGPGSVPGSVPRRSSCLLCFSCVSPLGILFTDKCNEIDNKNFSDLS
jgi:hypothetical protein